MTCICEAVGALCPSITQPLSPHDKLPAQQVLFCDLLQLVLQLTPIGVPIECHQDVLFAVLRWVLGALDACASSAAAFCSNKPMLRMTCTILSFITFEAHRCTVCGDAQLFLHVMARYSGCYACAALQSAIVVGLRLYVNCCVACAVLWILHASMLRCQFARFCPTFVLHQRTSCLLVYCLQLTCCSRFAHMLSAGVAHCKTACCPEIVDQHSVRWNFVHC